MSSIPQHLYAIRARWTPFVKVGITGSPEDRIKRMQTDTPHALRFIACVPCEHAYDVEYWLHGQLRRQNVRGEWFRIYRDVSITRLIDRGLALDAKGEIPTAPLLHERYQYLPMVTRVFRGPSTAEELLTLYALMRRYNIPREAAAAAFKASDLPFNNNVWSKAAPEDEPQVTPIAGRPTAAKFEHDPALAYEPPPR